MKGQQEAPGRPRIKISPARFTGRIEDWKGTFGWIQPEAPINHPEAAMKRGKVYLSQVDVEAEIEGVGSRVSYYVYADGSGLGAMNCRPAESPAIVKTLTKPTLPPQFAGCKGKSASAAATGKAAFAAPRGPGAFAARPAAAAPAAKGKGKAKDPGVRTRVSSAKVAGKIKSWTGNFGWIIPLETVSHPQYRGQIYLHKSDVESPELLQAGTQVEFFTYSDAQGLGAEECTLSDAVVQNVGVEVSQGEDVATDGAAEGQEKDMSRERLTVVPTTGEVIEWRSSFGWIRPHETVDHHLAAKRQGKVYIAKKDLLGEASLQAGQLVQFHIFADKSGLGAEECMPF